LSGGVGGLLVMRCTNLHRDLTDFRTLNATHLVHLLIYLFAYFCTGRTALHWAASVNNEEAAHVLLCHHGNVDAQDEYNQTPLFLAAREGSFQVARILLHQGKANVDLPDHMERFVPIFGWLVVTFGTNSSCW